MKKFNYTITEELGLHARPAGLLVKEVKKLDSEVTITFNDSTVSCGKLMALMGLGVACSDTVTVTIEGGNEDSSYETIRNFFESNL